jgi:hypothetical protein
MKHAVEHVFDATAERLWQVFFFDEAFVAGLYARLRVRPLAQELQYEGEGPSLIVRRRMRLAPTRELPPALRGLLRGPVVVGETGEFSAERRRYGVKIELPGAGGLISVGGDYTWETLPSGQLRRIWHGRCEARVPVLGARIERWLLAELEANLAEAYVFTCRWLREHPDPPRAAD